MAEIIDNVPHLPQLKDCFFPCLTFQHFKAVNFGIAARFDKIAIFNSQIGQFRHFCSDGTERGFFFKNQIITKEMD